MGGSGTARSRKGAVPEAGDLAELELYVVDSGLNAWTPIVEHLRRRLKAIESGALGVLEVEEAAIPLLVVLREALVELVEEPPVHLIEDDLDCGIHGAGLLLVVGEVVGGIQDIESDTRMLATQSNLGRRRGIRSGRR